MSTVLWHSVLEQEVQLYNVSGALVRNSPMCGSRKYPDPHHGGNWKFQGGWGVVGGGGGSEAQETPEGRGVGP